MATRKPNKNPAKPQRRPLLILVAAVLAVAGLVAFTLTRNPAPASAGSFVNVTVQDLAAATEPDRIILDVREQWEYDQVHVPGVRLIPLGELEARAAELPDDVPIYVICRSGNRSLEASDILLEAGKQDVRNVQGGILAWQQAGFAVEQ